MFKKKVHRIFFCFFFVLFFQSYLFSENDKRIHDISYYHSSVFKIIFEKIPISNFLHFGLSDDILFFLKNSDQVTTVCFDKDSSDHNNFFSYKKKLKDFPNWRGFLFEYSEKDIDSLQLETTNINQTSSGSNSSLHHLKTLIRNFVALRDYDCAFVDSTIFLSGEIVNELFGKVRIIIANDTNHFNPYYGWNKINTPANYTMINFDFGDGTTVWIDNEMKDLIIGLKGAATCSRKNLRVFFPNIDNEITKSIALAFNFLGHTLVLPGYSFSQEKKLNNLSLSPLENVENYFSKDKNLIPERPLGNVEIIESDEIIINPPDAIVINSLDNENEILKIYNKIIDLTTCHPKLIYFSQTPKLEYKSKNIKNFLLIDVCKTKELLNTPNVVCWIPWIDFQLYDFKPNLESKVFNTFSQTDKLFFEDFTSNFLFLNPISEVDFHLKSKESFSDYYLQLCDSSSTLSFSNFEKFDYSLIESIASGRPPFIKRSSSFPKILLDLCVENKTAFFFDSFEEFEKKLLIYLNSKEFRLEKQKEAATIIREMINNESQALVLDNFLQKLLDE